MGKIKMSKETATLTEVFDRFVTSQKAKGVVEETVRNYYRHLHCVSKHLNINATFDELTQDDISNMIVSMRESGLAQNTICSYTRVMKTFFNWCKLNGYTNLSVPEYKPVETVKETYSDIELAKLLKKPDKNCSFADYRNWVIVNFLVNCGCRAATIRNIQNKDVDLEGKQVVFRHNKNHKVQVIPLCTELVAILKSYMAIRKGDSSEYLFCNACGEMLTENALRLAITHYNRSRGVEKTSIHLLRHTFARKYLVDCGGNAFTLQKMLNHSTLKMTKHYCQIFDTDIVKDYDNYSPLTQMCKGTKRITMK